MDLLLPTDRILRFIVILSLIQRVKMSVLVFGFTNIVLNILDKEKPDYFAVVFDTPEPTFRHEMYKEYKAQRSAMPEDMVEQLPRINQVLDILQIPVISKPGFEADDVMGTLAHQAEKEDLETVLVTGDKDFMQLVTANTIVYDPKRAGAEPEWLDEKAVQVKMGISPDKIIDFLALTGDTSDNIPGVNGIGPKGAVKLLNTFGSLEEILANSDKISNKRNRESLQANIEIAKLSKILATIKCDVPLDAKPAELIQGEIDNQKAVEFFQEMEFRTLTDRFSQREVQVEKKYHLINTPEKLSAFIQNLSNQKVFSFDTETTSVDPMNAKLVGLSFSWKDGEAYYIPVKGPKDMLDETPVLDMKLVLDSLRPVLEDKKKNKCAHNAKYDMLVLDQHGVNVQGLEVDTMVASYLINPSARQHNLDAVTLEYLNFKKIPTSSLIGSGKKQITMDQVPVAKITEYACEDADMTWRLREVLIKKIKEYELESLLNNVEIPLVDVLLDIEKQGVMLDELFLARMSSELELDLTKLEKFIYELSDVKFNINSPKQLATILFEKLKLPPSKKTKTGYSTDVSVLEELAKNHELPKQILEYRQLAKLKSTYVDALPKLINQKSGRVHTSYNQTVAATGRLSSSDPNLQNIPIRTEVGRKIRRAFIPSDPEHVLLDADYSQIELRIMAHLSKDDTLMASFLQNEDVHSRTAALVFNVDADKVNADQRRKAKEVNFGIMYGMGCLRVISTTRYQSTGSR